MLGRRVGATRDGCVYSLITRVPLDVYQSLAAGRISGRDAFLAGAESGLSGTVDETGLSNIFDVDFYQHPSDIPERVPAPGALHRLRPGPPDRRSLTAPGVSAPRRAHGPWNRPSTS